MHISLDSALGRQRRLNSVGESVFQIAPNPSAGYSLRSLTGGDPAVVRVRRASDNSEKDFNSSGVSSGELVNWVNAQIVPPLDVRELVDGERTGALIPAAAAYSLRNLSTSYTGNVVDVRRSSDNAEDSFTAAEVSDGTLEAWVTAPLTDLIGNMMYFDRINDYIDLDSSVSYTGDFTLSFSFVPYGLNNIIQPIVGAGNLDYIGIANISGDRIYISTAAGGTQFITLDSNFNARSVNDVEISRSGSTITFTINGDVQSTTLTDSTTIPVSRIGARGAGVACFNGILTSLDFGQGTTFDGTIADGNAIGTVNGSPELFTGQGFDGFVTQWYDQSGNANHATQGTDASQPKIVDAGTLVSGGIDFDGTQKLEKLFPSGFNGKEQSHFVKFTPNSNLGYLVEFGGGIGAARTLSVEPYLRFNVVTQDYNSTILSGDSLLSMVCPDAPTTIDDYDLYYQGSLLTPDSLSGGVLAGVTSSDITIGDNAYIGKISEAILYNSDQSDNRTAFEANIGETYGIDLPSGVDTGYDQVDGFVETWYDQSGNGNDAVQETAGSQPKIVDAGVLVTDRDGKVALNGKGATLDPPSNAPMLSSDGSYSLFAVVDFDDQRNGNEAFNNIIGFVSKTDGGASSSRKPLIYAGQDNGEVRLTSPSNPSGTASLTLLETVGVQLLTNIANPALSTGNNTGYVDGVLVSSVNSNTDVNTEILTGTASRLFDLQETTVETFLSEVIYYPSDQSANRTAIETNINNQYDIY